MREKLSELDASAVVRLADCYFTSLYLQRQKKSPTESVVPSPAASKTPPSRRRRLPKRSSEGDTTVEDPLSHGVLRDCSEWPPTEKPPRKDLLSHRLTFALCERL